jgi:hypothetical protein
MIDVVASAHNSERSQSGRGSQLQPDEVAVILGAAGRAPSVHNTQPWRFAVRCGAMDLLADRRRILRLADPDSRELVISCGAALYEMRLGMRKLGYVPDVELVPAPGDSALLAQGYSARARGIRAGGT